MSRSDDYQRALQAITAFGCSPDKMSMLVIDGAPPSKARPRFGKGGRVHTSAESRAAEKRTRTMLRQAFKSPEKGNVSLVCIFFRPNRQRIDADNMLKHVCDAANGVIWEDDAQVTAITGLVELDEARPRTVICVAKHQSTMKRGVDDFVECGMCGGKIYIAGKQRRRKYCSTECASLAKHKPVAKTKKCGQCSELFAPANRSQKLCSEACRRQWMTGRNQAAKYDNSKCLDCGKELAHKRGGRCRPCWRLYVQAS